MYHYLKHNFFHTNQSQKSQKKLTEEQKIKSAILTDFILSIEIIIVALETVIDQSLITQIIAVSAVSIFIIISIDKIKSVKIADFIFCSSVSFFVLFKMFLSKKSI